MQKGFPEFVSNEFHEEKAQVHYYVWRQKGEGEKKVSKRRRRRKKGSNGTLLRLLYFASFHVFSKRKLPSSVQVRAHPNELFSFLKGAAEFYALGTVL